MKKKKLGAVFGALFLLISVPLTVFAVKSALKPFQSAGGYYHTVTDRVDFSVDYTQFTIKKTEGGAERCRIDFTLTAKKTEADFYAVLDHLDLTELDFVSASFLCTTAGMESAVPEALPLPVKNGESAPLSWNVSVTADFSAKGVYTAKLLIEYTAGLTKEPADSRLLEIPLTVTII